jgi:hypothetical protein
MFSSLKGVNPRAVCASSRCTQTFYVFRRKLYILVYNSWVA